MIYNVLLHGLPRTTPLFSIISPSVFSSWRGRKWRILTIQTTSWNFSKPDETKFYLKWRIAELSLSHKVSQSQATRMTDLLMTTTLVLRQIRTTLRCRENLIQYINNILIIVQTVFHSVRSKHNRIPKL